MHEIVTLSFSCTSPLTNEETRHVLLTYGLTGLVSVFVCLLAVILAFVFKLFQKFLYRLAVYQVVSALILGIIRSLQLVSLDNNKNVNSPDYDKFCISIAFMTVSLSWMKLVFTVWVTIHVFVYSVWLKNMKKLEVLYVLSSILIGLSIGAVPLFTDTYGQAGPWCWIENRRNSCAEFEIRFDGEIQQIYLWFGPAVVVLLLMLLLVVVMLIILICKVHFKKCLNLKEESIPLLNALLNRQKEAMCLSLPLLAYPLIFCALIIIPISNRLYEAVSKKSSYPLFLASAFCIPAMSCAAGIALIVHIIFPKCSAFKQLSTDLEQQQQVMRSRNVSTATTHTVLLRESDFENSTIN